jgi:hypothetical protein
LPRYGGTGGSGVPAAKAAPAAPSSAAQALPATPAVSAVRASSGSGRRGCAVGRQRDQRADVNGLSGRLLRRMLGVHERAGVVGAAVGVEDQAVDRLYAHTDR